MNWIIYDGRRWRVTATDRWHVELRADDGERMVRSKVWVALWTKVAS